MFTGDTYPAALLEISDETGVLDLSSASDIQVIWVGEEFTFFGAGVAIWPAEEDPDTIHNWNLTYDFADDDTSEVDVYTPYIVVTWSAGNIQTFIATGYSLTVEAAPVT
jgi:hypothetical protein